MNIFEAKNLTIKFNEEILLENLNFAIKKRNFTVITGLNGSGKSVLCKTLLNLLDEYSGEIFFDGISLKDNLKALRQDTFLVFQEAAVQILGATVLEDLSWTLQNERDENIKEQKINTVLQSVNLTHKKFELSKNLSGGEKRKLAIANALLKETNVFVFDEIFANLDYLGVKQVLEILYKLKAQQKTIILITHELEKIEPLIDEIIILANKTIVLQGKRDFVLDNLKENFGVHHPHKSWL